MASTGRLIVRTVLGGVLAYLCLLVLFMLFPPQGVPQILGIQQGIVVATVFLSILSIALLMRSRRPNYKSEIGVYLGVVAVAIGAASWLPQWSGFIAVAAFVLLVLTPSLLTRIGNRRLSLGYAENAVLYLRLACFFHPSRRARFNLSFASAAGIGPIEEKITRYGQLAVGATPEQFALLNYSIALDQGDWNGVLGQIRGADDALSAMKRIEIRALGELGQVDEMIKTYASAHGLSEHDSHFCRLFVLAFAGRVDGVHFLLARPLQYLRPMNKSYWSFIADQAGGGHDDDLRRRLASYASATEDETFRRNAQRHLDAMPISGGVALSSESQAAISAIENKLKYWKGVPV